MHTLLYAPKVFQGKTHLRVDDRQFPEIILNASALFHNVVVVLKNLQNTCSEISP